MKRRQREVPTPSPTVRRATMVQVTARPESPLPFGPVIVIQIVVLELTVIQAIVD
jgi:hypothetical protein